ncbi:hypothetical protein [Vreelandella venusta]|uniref:hypothetical protein n=1 Tax=Vreelandella venusta TaxID=44935 RepID=UPI003C2B8738
MAIILAINAVSVVANITQNNIDKFYLLMDKSAPESGLKMIEKPNLFSFATIELSQNAFIAWLFAWADTQYSSAAPQLHACARGLIAAFFTKHGKPVPHFPEVSVTRQSKHIDVLCVLGSVRKVLRRI